MKFSSTPNTSLQQVSQSSIPKSITPHSVITSFHQIIYNPRTNLKDTPDHISLQPLEFYLSPEYLMNFLSNLTWGYMPTYLEVHPNEFGGTSQHTWGYIPIYLGGTCQHICRYFPTYSEVHPNIFGGTSQHIWGVHTNIFVGTSQHIWRYIPTYLEVHPNIFGGTSQCIWGYIQTYLGDIGNFSHYWNI